MGSLREHHCYAPAICSLLPRGLKQAPNTCLRELLGKVLGERLQLTAGSRQQGQVGTAGDEGNEG